MDSYADGDLYHFMDNETYDDIPVNVTDVPDNFKFCKENEVCKLLSYKGKVFSVEIPNFIELGRSPRLSPACAATPPPTP